MDGCGKRKLYSLENKIYPLSSLESEMERLFGYPVWYEDKVKMCLNSEEPEMRAQFFNSKQFEPLVRTSRGRFSCARDFTANNTALASSPQNSNKTNSSAIARIQQLFAPAAPPKQHKIVASLPSSSIKITNKGAFPSTFHKLQPKNKKQMCKFCAKKGERPEIFESHALRDDSGKLCCPILRSYVCCLCGATGDSAHTKKYCPLYGCCEEDFIGRSFRNLAKF